MNKWLMLVLIIVSFLFSIYVLLKSIIKDKNNTDDEDLTEEERKLIEEYKKEMDKK